MAKQNNFTLSFLGGDCRSNFTKGGVNLFLIPKNDATDSEIAMSKGREGYYGWFGAGGSVVQWHPELKIGFAFIPTLMSHVEMVNERGAVLQKIVKDCCSISTNKEWMNYYKGLINYNNFFPPNKQDQGHF